MSDFKKSTKTAWQFGGAALYEHRFNKDLMMRYGVMYNKEFFGHLIIPVIHLEWSITEKLSAVGMLPVYFKIKYMHNKNLEYGLSFVGLSTSFRLGGENYKDDYIVRQSIDFALYERFHLGENIHLETKIGVAIGRRYDQYSSNDKIDLAIPLKNFNDNRTIKNVPFNNGAFINLKLVYSLPIK